MTFHFFSRGRATARVTALLFITCASATVAAQSTDAGWKAGAVLDASLASDAMAMGERDKGPGLGHSDINVSGPLGQAFQAQATAVAHTQDRKLEVELEEAWAQTRRLPAGLQLRAGRFASQLGYLNERHPHTDDFIQRPLLHRAFLGSHWTDDGLRVNWTAPTDLYLRLGLEAFQGRRLVESATATPTLGVVVASGRVGGDLGSHQSWQAGLAFMHNRRGAPAEAEEDHGHADAHAAGHGAQYAGRRVRLAEVAWKWAPQGNNRQQQVRVTYEHAVISGLGPLASAGDRHRASYLGAVWRFAPAWETGVRADLLQVRQLHEDAYEDGRLREAAWMLAYQPGHAQTVRLQLSRQQDRGGFSAASHAVQVQYIRHWGAHAAHSF